MGQLSYVHGASETPLIGQTIGAYFDQAAERYGERLTRWSSAISRSAGAGASCGERVDAFAAGLLALGLEPGERIGIWSPNNAEWVVTQFATAKAGLILVNINPAYRLSELEYALNKAGCKALVTAARFKTSDYLGMLGELAPELATSAPGAAARGAAARSAPRHHDRRDDAGRAGCGSTMSAASAAMPSASSSPPSRRIAVRRPDQHPVHQRHHRLPQGRHPDPPQHPEQRLLRRRGDAARRPTTGSASRCRSIIASAW